MLWTQEYQFPFTLGPRIWKKEQPPVILDFCLKKTGTGKPPGYRDVIVYEKLRFKNIFFHMKTQSRLFQIPPVWRPFTESFVFLTDYCGQ